MALSGARRPQGGRTSSQKLDAAVAKARQDSDARATGYREQALKMYPWVCGRCAREFTHANLRELTVHHRNHDHDFNPSDGSNWELLCLYCHDNEHQRLEEAHARGERLPDEGPKRDSDAKHNPFAALGELLKRQS